MTKQNKDKPIYQEKHCPVCNRTTLHSPEGKCLDCAEKERDRKGMNKGLGGVKVHW